MNNKHIIFSITALLVIFLGLFIFLSNKTEPTKKVVEAKNPVVKEEKREARVIDNKEEARVIDNKEETKEEKVVEEKVDFNEKREINEAQVESEIQKLPELTIDTNNTDAIVDDIMDLSDKDDTLLIDVRSRDKYEKDHIEGAISVTYDEIKNGALDSLPKDKKIQVYCQKGIKSSMAAEHLKECGFENVENLGGIEGLKMPHVVNNQTQTN